MRIAVMQTEPILADPGTALARLDAAAGAAAKAGADILVTPEMFLSGYNIGRKRVADLAQPLDGAQLARVGALAEQRRIAIVIGFPERAANGTIYNAAAFFDRAGRRLSNYRKTHLYGDVDRTQFTAGDGLCQPFDFEGWKLALAICYDIEFPELARSLARQGAEAILTPTANMLPYDSVATRLVPARAQENAVYVVYANYVGSEPPFDYCGLSCICGPDGEDIARAGRDSTIIYGDISRTRLQEARRSATHLADARPDLYQINQLPEDRDDRQ